jgi:hypothetical protein
MQQTLSIAVLLALMQRYEAHCKLINPTACLTSLYSLLHLMKHLVPLDCEVLDG